MPGGNRRYRKRGRLFRTQVLRSTHRCLLVDNNELSKDSVLRAAQTPTCCSGRQDAIDPSRQVCRTHQVTYSEARDRGAGSDHLSSAIGNRDQRRGDTYVVVTARDCQIAEIEQPPACAAGCRTGRAADLAARSGADHRGRYDSSTRTLSCDRLLRLDGETMVALPRTTE
jgi:hypothetical protein